MQLTLHTDYGLRVLIYLALSEKKRCNVAEIADSYAISRDHLVKVVQGLAAGGFVETRRGRAGGISLSRPPEEIRLGDVVRRLESGFPVVDCMSDNFPSCRLRGVCGLEGIVGQALNKFLETFDRYSLADCLGRPDLMRAQLRMGPPVDAPPPGPEPRARALPMVAETGA